jgi:hypothetical protein
VENCLIFLACRYILVEFRTPDEANFALQAMHGHAFDARHQFKLNRFTDVELYANMDETYVEPQTEEFKPRVRKRRHRMIGFIPQSFLGTLAGMVG